MNYKVGQKLYQYVDKQINVFTITHVNKNNIVVYDGEREYAEFDELDMKLYDIFDDINIFREYYIYNFEKEKMSLENKIKELQYEKEKFVNNKLFDSKIPNNKKDKSSTVKELKIEVDIFTIIEKALGVSSYKKIQMDSKFEADLGADSLDCVELVMRFEDFFDIDIPDEVMPTLIKVEDLVKYIKDVKNV